MNLIYVKGNNVVGVNDKYIYLEEIFEYTPNSGRLANSRYISCTKPLSLSKSQSYKKFPKERRSLSRTLTLIYAPQHYLEENEYLPIKGVELLKYVKHRENH